MINLLPKFFLNEPRRLGNFGQGLVWIGCMLLLFGALGHVATAAQSALHSFGGSAAAMPTLAALYPDLPTWWVPESLIGCLPAVLQIGLGWTVNGIGKELLRVM